MDHMRWRTEQLIKFWVYMEEHHLYEMAHPNEHEIIKPLFEIPPQNRLAEKPYLYHSDSA